MKIFGKYIIPVIAVVVIAIFAIQQLMTQWPEGLMTVPEKTRYERTSLHAEVMDFIVELDSRSDLVHVETVAASAFGKKVPLVVIADPPVMTPGEAESSGKPVIYLQGNIHGGEVEGKEALLQLMREIALGDKRDLLSDQILLFAPIYNADGNDLFDEQNRSSQHNSPVEVGERASGEGHDLNRDAVKVDAVETKGLINNVLLRWDPIFLLDMHTTNGSWHGYSLTYASPYTPTAHPAPQGYVFDSMLPELQRMVKDDFNLDMFLYGGFSTRGEWPPTQWTQGGYSPNAWFVVNYMGLRNRMAILSETFAHDPFEQRIRSAKAFALSIIRYTNEHGREMEDICRKADEDVINSVLQNYGTLEKGVLFGVEPLEEPVDILIYDHEPYTDTVMVRNEETGEEEQRIRNRFRRLDNKIIVKDVRNVNKFVVTREQSVPRGYLIPEEFERVAHKLMEHGIQVSRLDNPVTARGEEFNVERFTQT
ncbi:M14 family metallopeptidase, partial [candidate division KSB1 bacterium]